MKNAAEQKGFKLNHLFIIEDTKQPISIDYFFNKDKKISTNLLLNKKIIEQISNLLYLEYLPVEPEGGNVCYAESPEVRDDFKTYFTTKDLFDYLWAILQNKRLKENPDLFIPYPKENTFWKSVNAGKEIRDTHSIHFSYDLSENISNFSILSL